MKRLHIDYALPSLRRTLYRTPLLAWALLCAAVFLSVIAVLGALDYDRRVAAYHVQRALVATRVHEARPESPVPPQPKLSDVQARAINAVIEQLNLPWRALYVTVQSATPPTVALLSLEPDAKTHALRITAEARNSEDMIDYVQALQRKDQFTSATLVHHEINDRDPNRPLRFQIEAQWRGQ